MAPGTSSDEKLVQSAQQGILEAFNTLYERYLPAVYNRVCYIVPEQDAEDVTQEIFIAMMKSLKSFRGESRFSTWLRTLTNRQIADYYRRRSPMEAHSKLEEDSHLNPNASYSTTNPGTGSMDEMIMVRQAMQKLPENYREIILLRFADGLQFNEIAEQQGQSLEATKSLFRRAILALNKQLGQ
jgi:RNA polymerase sigma-70 factor (ECF subfamily)